MATSPHSQLLGLVGKRALQLLLQHALTGALMFGAAGNWRWARGWVYLGLSVALIAANFVYVLPRNAEVIAARSRNPLRGAAAFDKVVVPLYTLCAGASYVVGALDGGRFGWAPLSWAWTAAGAALLALGGVPVAGALAANRNLEPTVRIQTDRGHQVATGGPYRVVRHPMYAGLLLQLPATALVLGSAWALLPAAAAMLMLVVRTALEDRTLQRDLPGYADYARKTRFRLVPGLW